MKRLTLIDLDSIVYIVAYQAIEHDNPIEVEATVRNFIDEILTNTEAEAYAGYYQKKGHSNFRFNIFPGYKAKRPSTPEYITKWRPLIHTIFDSYVGVTGLEAIESDDALSIMYYKHKDNYDITIAHIDKDLNCIPGKHYKYTAKLTYELNENEAKLQFCTQVIAGDSSDSIPSIPGVGPAKARKYLTNNKTLAKAYKQAAKEKKVNRWIELYYQTYHCIRLLQNINELSQFTDVKEVNIDIIDEFDYDEHEPGPDQDNAYALDF